MSRLCYAIFLLSLPCTALLPAAEEVRLSSLDLGLAQQGWGKPGIDRSVEGKPLRIAGRDYAHGYGTHAPGEVHLNLDGKVARFTAHVGIDDEGGAIGRDGSVEFIVEADGKALWRSQLMHGGMEAQPINVALTGTRHLVLRVTDGGDGNARDHADWADAVFHVAGGRPVVVVPSPPPPRWILGDGMTTVWPVATDACLPHERFHRTGRPALRPGGPLPGRREACLVDETQRGLALSADRPQQHPRQPHPPLRVRGGTGRERRWNAPRPRRSWNGCCSMAP